MPAREIAADANLIIGSDGRQSRVLPRCYITALPKSGLHLVDAIVSAVCTPAAERNWFGNVSGGGFGGDWVNLHIQERIARSLRPGQYAKGHAAWNWPLERALYGFGVGTIFVYRDLRDVVVSQAHHVLSDDDERLRHPDKNVYRQLPDFEAVLVAVIEGIDQFPGLFDRWEMFAPWLYVPWVHRVRFEDAIRDRTAAVRGVIEYLYRVTMEMNGLPPDGLSEVAMRQLVLAAVQRSRDTSQSVTFRRGKIGGWRDAFTPRVGACFRGRDPGWLVRLGYERGDDW
jgi:hypothetical protein